MEIIFELEDPDIEIEFTPDFDWMHKTHPGRNRCDFSKVQWQLLNRSGTTIMADVQFELPDETTDYVIYFEADVV